MFDKATLSFGTTKVMSKVALSAGSSQHGNARRASVGWKENKEVWNNAFGKTDTISNLTKPGSICINYYSALYPSWAKRNGNHACPLCKQGLTQSRFSSCPKVLSLIYLMYDILLHNLIIIILPSSSNANVIDHSRNVMKWTHADRKWKWLKATLLLYTCMSLSLLWFKCFCV